MKKVTTILLLSIASICKGQDSSKTTFAGTGIILASPYYSWELKHTKDFDTTNVTLICIDSKEQETGPTFFVKAIKVKKYVPGGWKGGDYYSPAHWEHFCYLTKEMNPFQFTVIQCLND